MFRLLFLISLVLLCIVNFSLSQTTYNAIISSSPSGKYIIACNLKSGEVSILDVVKKEKVYTLIKNLKYDFITWSGDTSVYYSERQQGITTVFEYSVKRNELKSLSIVNQKIIANLHPLAFSSWTPPNVEPFIIYRNVLKQETSTVYMDTTILYKFYPLSNKLERLLNVNNLLGTLNIEGMSVNATGDKLLIATQKKGRKDVSIYQLDVKTHKTQLIEESGDIDPLHIFYINNQDQFVYFKHFDENGENTEAKIICYDIKDNKSYVLDILKKGHIPIYVVDVPLIKSVLITYLDIEKPIELNESKRDRPTEQILEILEGWTLSVFNKPSIVQVSYSPIIDN